MRAASNAVALQFGSRGLAALARVITLVGAAFFAGQASAVTNLFSTRFEAAEGYNFNLELIGQQGWITDSSSYGGNGLLTNSAGAQSAYIGYYPLDPQDDYLALWQPLNYSPLQSSNPVVRFSVLMAIVDSTSASPKRDDFYWSVYNSNGENLFTLDFYNGDLGVYYALNSTNTLFYTGVDFTNDVDYTPYALTVTMDFARNRWSATLDNRTLVTNAAISAVTNVLLDLGDIDALWVLDTPSAPGDNYMVFDDYQVSASISPNMPPRLISLGRNSSQQFGLRLEGAFGARYAIEATTNLLQWAALRTNTATNGVFEFRDPGSTNLPRRFYRARGLRPPGG